MDPFIDNITKVMEDKSICLTCLNESNNMTPIFLDDGAAEIWKMLEMCSRLNIHALDGFSINICSNCLNKVHISYEFRLQCEISHNALVNFMRNQSDDAHNTKEQEEVMMDTVCRTCLNDSNNLTPIFVNDGNDTCTMLKSCSGLNIQPMNGFPDNICADCFNKAHISYEFQRQCDILGNFIEAKMKHVPDAITDNGNELHSDTVQTYTNLVNGCELHKCNRCPNQYITLEQLQGHIISYHGTYSIINNAATEADGEHNNSMAINLIMDCVEEKYKIPESGMPCINLKESNKDPNDDDDNYQSDDDSGNESDNSLRNEILIYSEDDDPNSNHKNNNIESQNTKIIESTVDHTTFPRKVGLNTENLQLIAQKSPLILHEHLPIQNKHKHMCTICGRIFARAYSLLCHIREHTRERPYKCSHCDQKFTQNCVLESHVRQHEATLSWCNVCGVFIEGNQLSQHNRKHRLDKQLQINKFITWFISLAKTFNGDPLQKMHLCKLCGKGFQYAHSLHRHSRVHTLDRPYNCPYCTTDFTRWSDLKCHVERHTNERFKCDICGHNFVNLAKHKRTQHGKKSRCKCNICGGSFFYLAKHKRNQHGKRSRIKCDICGESFFCLARHKRRQHGGKLRLKCDICGDSFLNLAKHKRRQHGNRKRLKCNICGESFFYLAEHKRSQHGNRVQCKCDICGDSYFDVAKHKRSQHEKRSRSKCDICGDSFLYLEKHIRRLHGKRNRLKCNICGESFFQLATHKRRQHGNRERSKCDICGDSFFYLAKHKRSQHGNRVQSKCDICGDSYFDLAKHKRSQHEQRSRSKCDICGDSFLYLEKHIHRLHGKRRRFKCNICGESFFYLAKHKRSQHGNRVQSNCDICGDSYFDLAKHKRSQHEKRSRSKCDICGDSFLYLEKHIRRLHGKRKRVKCNICGESFFQLATHKRRQHGNRRRSKCDLCGDSFIDLVSHKRHKHERRFRSAIHGVPVSSI